MRVLLCHVGIRNIGFNAFYENLHKGIHGELDSFIVPTGITILGAYLRESGHDVDYLDLRFVRDWIQAERKIKESRPGLVAVSFQTPNREYAIELCSRAKSLGIPTVVGGAHVSSLPQDALEQEFFDYIIVGEGEISLPALVDALERGETPERLQMGTILTGVDVSRAPLPYFSPLYETVIQAKKIGFLITSRGCPGRCYFCQPVLEKLYGKKMKFQDLDQVFRQIDNYIQSYGVSKFFFMDDMFTSNKKRVRKFAERLETGKYSIQYDINARVDYFDEEVAECLLNSGCNLVSFGFESGSDRKLALINKNTTREQNLRIGKLWKSTGRLVLANILVGVPGETEEDLEQDLTFIEELDPDAFYYNVMVPYPGTHFWRMLNENKQIKNMDFSLYEMNINKKIGLVKGVDYDLLAEYEKKFANLRRKLEKRRLLKRMIQNPLGIGKQVLNTSALDIGRQIKNLF